MAISEQYLPPESMAAASFATSLAAKFVHRGGNPVDLFSALAGIVCSKEPKLGAECLVALEGAIDGGGVTAKTHASSD
jgi:hypothetical protein